MGPVSAKSYPGQRLVRARPPADAPPGTPAERAKQEADYGRRASTYVYGAFDAATGTAFTACYERRTTASFVDFLERLEVWVPAEVTSVYVILDNLSAHKGTKIKAWCAKNNVELCFTPTYSSWANPIECHFGPLRDFVLNNSDHPNHTVLTKRLHAYLHWRNGHAADPVLRERVRRERARLRSERQRRWGRPAQQPAAAAA